MPRADQAQRVLRVNLAFRWLQAGLSPPEVTQRLAAQIGISSRQAYRYVTEAQQMNAPMAAVEAKAVFTLKLPQSPIARLHQYSESTGQTLTQIVSQVLLAFFRRGGRG